MKEEDRSRACEVFEQIETDLVYHLIETYQGKEFENFAETLETLKLFLDVSGQVCRR